MSAGKRGNGTKNNRYYCRTYPSTVLYHVRADDGPNPTTVKGKFCIVINRLGDRIVPDEGWYLQVGSPPRQTLRP